MTSRHTGLALLFVSSGALALAIGCSSPSEGGPGNGDVPVGGDDGGLVQPGEDGSTGDDAGGGGGGGGGDDGGTTGKDGGMKKDSGPAGDAGPDCTGLAYCDGFEAYTGAVTNGMALGPWMASVNNATVTVDTTKAYRGTKSLHIIMASGTGPGTQGVLGQKNTAGLVTGNNMYGRAMIYFSNTGGNGLPLGVHSWMFSSSGNSQASGGGVSLNMGGGGKNAQPQLNYHPASPPAPAGTESSVVMGTWTAGAWHCVQWEFDGSGNPVADHAKMSIDGVVQVDVPKTKGWDLATPWQNMNIGFTHYQTLSNGVEVWLDEFAVDGAPIACPK